MFQSLAFHITSLYYFYISFSVLFAQYYIKQMNKAQKLNLVTPKTDLSPKHTL